MRGSEDVGAGPDDLLVLGGQGFSEPSEIVYAQVADTTSIPAAPPLLPVGNSASAGWAEFVNISTPEADALTIRLPAELVEGESYALWVRRAR